MTWNDENLINTLTNNGTVVMLTDTLYGIVGLASNSIVVNRIYSTRKRAGTKPCIILISSLRDIEKFSITISEEQKKALLQYWSFDSVESYEKKPVSVVLDCTDESFAYLHRGTHTLAFRIPKNQELVELLSKVGPLIAPSANIEGMPPANNITEAKNYFGDLVDLYVDGGEVNSKASKVIKLHKDGSADIIRE